MVDAFDVKQVVLTPAMLHTKDRAEDVIEYFTSLIESSFLPPIPKSLYQTTGRRLLRNKALSQQKEGKSDISQDKYAKASEREQQRHHLRQIFYVMYCQHQFLQEKGRILIVSNDGIQSLPYVSTKEGERTACLELGKRFRGKVIFIIPASRYWESEFLSEYGRKNENYPATDNNIGLLVKAVAGSSFRVLPLRL